MSTELALAIYVAKGIGDARGIGGYLRSLKLATCLAKATLDT